MTLKSRLSNLEAQHKVECSKLTRTMLCGPETDETTIAEFERRAEVEGCEAMVIRLIPGQFLEPADAEHSEPH